MLRGAYYVWIHDSKRSGIKMGVISATFQLLCVEGKIEGAMKHASVWAISQDAQKPKDERIVSGKYIKSKKNNE